MNETPRNTGKMILIISVVKYCFSFGSVRMEYIFPIAKNSMYGISITMWARNVFFEWIVLEDTFFSFKWSKLILEPHSCYLELLVRDSCKFEIKILVEHSNIYLGQKSLFILFGCLIYTLFFWEEIFTTCFVVWKTRYLSWWSIKTLQFFIAFFIAMTHNINETDWCLPIGFSKNIRNSDLTHFSSMSQFYNPWKHQKTTGFLTYSGGIEMWHWTKVG